MLPLIACSPPSPARACVRLERVIGVHAARYRPRLPRFTHHAMFRRSASASDVAIDLMPALHVSRAADAACLISIFAVFPDARRHVFSPREAMIR